jgi:hypothetical protein
MPEPVLSCPINKTFGSDYCPTTKPVVHFPCNYTPSGCSGPINPNVKEVRCCL